MVETGRRLGLAAGLLAAITATAQPQQPDTIDALRRVRDALVSAEDFSAALEPAERVVEQTDDGESPAAVPDLIRLARVQAELDMFTEAELNYLDAIERLRESEGEFSENLVPAYRALGRAYIDNRDFTSALSVLEQAQHISQRDAGLYNVAQSDVIDDMTLAYLGLGDTSEARDLQLERLENAVRQFGADDPRVVPYRAHLADYYDQSRLRLSAREQHVRNLEIQQSESGELDPRLLPTLRAILAIDFALGEIGEEPERIERILAAGDVIDPRERSESLAVLGDLALISGTFAEAESYYARAFDALAGHDPTAAADAFAAPRVLDFVAPLSAVDRAARNRPYAWGTIVLEFDVSAEGRARAVETVSMQPQAAIADDFTRRVRETHFRPRLVDGVPVVTRGVRFSHDFRHYVERDRD